MIRMLALTLLLVSLPAATAAQTHDHSAHQPPPPPASPAISDADRQAAFPDVRGHAVHDTAINYYVLVDQLEWWRNDGDGWNWDTRGWVGQDRDRLWFRTEGAGSGGDAEGIEAQIFYGRAIGRWWDVVAGVRQDFAPGPSRTWAAVGIQGLAPYWFEIEATAFIGASGRTLFRFETEYELLLTNRLVLQPLVEVDIYGKADPERAIGAGLSSGDVGLRVRYEIRREIAPYVGVTWHRKFFGTADRARAAGEPTGGARFVVGMRLWM